MSSGKYHQVQVPVKTFKCHKSVNHNMVKCGIVMPDGSVQPYVNNPCPIKSYYVNNTYDVMIPSTKSTKKYKNQNIQGPLA